VRALETSRSLPFLPKPQNLEGYVGEEQEFDTLGFSDTFDMRWLREAHPVFEAHDAMVKFS